MIPYFIIIEIKELNEKAGNKEKCYSTNNIKNNLCIPV